jgi:hypothetical protein
MQLHVVGIYPEETYIVVYVIGCVLVLEELLCASHILSRLIRMLGVCFILEEM